MWCRGPAAVTAQQPRQGEGNGKELEGAEISNIQDAQEECRKEHKAPVRWVKPFPIPFWT